MADDWLSSAVDGLSLDSGLEPTDSPSLSSNISQLLKSTRRDRADLEARLAQLRGFIQQTDEVMRGILESGDPSLAAKYSHLAGTRRSLEQNATHLQQLLLKVTESEARARQLAERGRQLEADEAGGVEVEAIVAAGAAAGATTNDRPDHEQKVAVVRGRPGSGATRKRDAGEIASDSLRAAVLHNWGSMERDGAARTRTFSSAQDEPAEDGETDWGAAVPMDRLLRALRGDPARPGPPPPAGALLGAEAALRDKAVELDATRKKLQQLRQLMVAVQDARQSGSATPSEAPAELRALLGDVEAALDGTDGPGEPERGDCRGCDDGGRPSGPHSLPPAGVLRPPGRVTRGTPAGEASPVTAPGCRRSAGREAAPPARPTSADRAARAASMEPAFLMGHRAAAEPAPSTDGDIHAQLQHVTALVHSLSRPPLWSSPSVWPGVCPAGQYPHGGWPYSSPAPPPPPTNTVDIQHQQTLSALGQCFQLLQSQQQQILEMQRQMQTTAAAVASASQPVTPAPPPPPPPPQFLAPALLRVDEPPTMELADGFGPQSGSMLNNQVAPGSRANNYWDNFRSYSRQNLLSGGVEGEREGERPRGDSESQDEPRAEGFMARPRTKKQKVNKENQQLDRAASNTRGPVPDPTRPRVHRASTPQNNPQVDAIYSCVTALIAQNQEEPEFLINLLHDLQLVRTESQRRQLQLAVQSIVVEELSGARHKQRNRTASAAAAQPAAAAHLLAAEREEIKSHVVSKHTNNLSHSLRPDSAEASGGSGGPGAHADLEDTTAKNLAPHKNAVSKNTAKPKTFEPAAAGVLPLDDSELQLARLLHEMNVFLNDHQAALLSPVLLARLERLLLRAVCQGRAASPPAGLNQQLEQAMVPFMGQPVAEAGGRLVQAVLERLGAALRGRELPAEPPPASLASLGLDSESEEEERPTEPPDSGPGRSAAEGPLAGHQLPADDGPQTIPEQLEAPSLIGRQERTDPADSYTPRHSPEPATGTLECPNAAEPDI